MLRQQQLQKTKTMKKIDVYSAPTVDLTWDIGHKDKMKDYVKESDLRSKYTVISWHDEETISPFLNVHLPYFININDMIRTKYTNNTIWLCGMNERIFITDRNMALYYGKQYKGEPVTKDFRITFDKKLIGKKLHLVTFKRKVDGLEYTGIYLDGKIYVHKEDLHSNTNVPDIECLLSNKGPKNKLERNHIEECVLKPYKFDDNGLSCLYTTYIKDETHFFEETKDEINLDEKYYVQMALVNQLEEVNRSFLVNEFNYTILCEEQDSDIYLYGNGMLIIKCA